MTYFILENADAFFALPGEVKIMILAALLIMIVYGIVRKLWSLVKIIAVIALAYFALTGIGII